MDAFMWIWLTCCLGLGNNRFWQLMSLFPSYREAYDAFHDNLNVSVQKKYLSSQELKLIRTTHDEQIQSVVDYCQNHGIAIICYTDNSYPRLLRQLSCPPAVLYCKGDTAVLENEFAAAVVGARKVSDYSAKVANVFAAELAEAGFTVVSGFAEGIDITSHLAAVRAGGKTIAVLGCGVDYDYPQPNRQFREKIEENGLFVSEFLPKSTPGQNTFLTRNRILSGLSLCTIVIEAGERSGSLSTVSHAVSQGKEVFVIPPHDIFDSRYLGNISLIHDGAYPLTRVSEITGVYYGNYRHNTDTGSGFDTVNLDMMNAAEESSPRPMKKNQPKMPAPTLDENEQIIYNILKTHPAEAELIAAEAGMEISDALMLLTDLEMDGIVEAADGQKYSLV